MNVIYKATNKINGKSYIGFDSNWPRRKRQHENSAKRKDGYYFHKALNKYGMDNFEWTILKENATLEDERLLIVSHETYLKGYNLTMGGEGILGMKHSDDTKKKLSEKAKLRKITPERLETLRRNAQIMKERGHTEETKKRISESHKGKVFTDEHLSNLTEANQKRDKSFMYTEEYKEKMSNSLKGKKRTPEQRARIAAGRLGKKFPRIEK